MSKVAKKSKTRYDSNIKTLSDFFVLCSIAKNINNLQITSYRKDFHKNNLGIFVMRKRHVSRFISKGDECENITAIVYSKDKKCNYSYILENSFDGLQPIRYSTRTANVSFNLAKLGMFNSLGIVAAVAKLSMQKMLMQVYLCAMRDVKTVG